MVLECCAHCSLAAAQRTGDGGFLERCADVSRRWRKRLSARSRGVARCTALLLLSPSGASHLDPSLSSAVARAQMTTLRTERSRKNLQKPATLIRLKTGLRAHLFVCAGALDLHIAAGRASCYFLAACEATRSADPLARSTAALLVSALPAAPAPWRGRLMATRHGCCVRRHGRRHGWSTRAARLRTRDGSYVGATERHMP